MTDFAAKMPKDEKRCAIIASELQKDVGKMLNGEAKLQNVA